MKVSKENTTIGFVGIGVMGRSMAGHLLGAGYPLHIYTRTKKSADGLVIAGAVWEESVKALAGKCDVIFTMLGFPPDVEHVYFGEQGLLTNMKSGTYVVDMSTSRPDLAMKIFKTAASGEVHALDAPVSGGDIGARDARLSIMVGGEQEAFDTVLPLFQLMGTNIVFQGSAGKGQHTKMCNQIAIAAGMMGVCEAFAYAEKAGLDPQTVLKSIESGAAGSWSLSNLVPRIIAGDYAPGFYVKHFIKDMAIAIEAADSMGVEVPGLKLAKSLYVRLAEAGGENDGTQALYKLYSSK